MNITCGCDPEVLVISGNQALPAFDRGLGTKDSPRPVEGSKTGLMVQEDGVALEFNISPVPLTSFAKTIKAALKELSLIIPNYFGPKASYLARDGWLFEPQQLQHPKALEFGCDPDFLAHSRGAVRKPLSAKQLGDLRVFGGHIHVGYDKKKPGEQGYIPEWAIVQGIELGAYLDMVMNGIDMQDNRRKFYGLAGLYRPKPYGLEYRTPSNFWLNNPQAAEKLFTAASTVINNVSEFRKMYDGIDWSAVQTAIDTMRISGSKYDSLVSSWQDFAAAAK